MVIVENDKEIMKCLVAGWFSFEQMGATAGDLIARDLLCDRLRDAGISYEVAVAPPFTDGVDWRKLAPENFTDVIFVCGPFGNGWPVTEMLERFAGKRFTGVNLSMLQSLEEWNPFQLLLERDSSRCTHPDITFMGPEPKLPLVGVIEVHLQKEYGKRAMRLQVKEHISALLNEKKVCAVRIDTSLIDNENGFTMPEEVETLISRMDLVVTTRLHGTVLSLKNGVPVIPIDPISGGAKIAMQVKELGWPLLFKPEDLHEGVLESAFEFCRTDEARMLARKCGWENRQKVRSLLDNFMSDFTANKQHRASVKKMIQ